MEKGNIAFAKARYEFCVQIFEQEKENRESLEKKAQLNFSFITIFLGAVFLNIGFFDSLKTVLQNNKSAIPSWVIYIPLTIFAVSLFLSLITLITTIQIRSYRAEAPANISSLLFGIDSEFLSAKTEIELISKLALGYSEATEHNRKVNQTKAKLIQLATYLITLAIISLFLVLWFFVFIFLA